jgi:murein DD-endopeptidase MepM/ murein hydrolase activator NlpD
MKRRHSVLAASCASALLLVAPVVQALAAEARAGSVVSWQPAKLVRGSAVLFQVRVPSDVSEVSGKWLGHTIKFTSLPAKGAFYGLAGIPVETAPGSYELNLIGNRAHGAFRYVKRIKIGQAQYPKVSVRVSKQFTEPDPEQLKKIAADKETKQAVFAKGSESQLWKGDFEAPVNAPISDVFGTERVFNGQVQSRHLGMDYAVPAGTPVHAINRGTVILAQSLYFEGGFVVIDHGEGIMSLYLHLSEFRVKEGDEVSAGDLIALSGGSGRATGPHLHLAVRWQGVYLDPAVVLNLEMPK